MLGTHTVLQHRIQYRHSHELGHRPPRPFGIIHLILCHVSVVSPCPFPALRHTRAHGCSQHCQSCTSYPTDCSLVRRYQIHSLPICICCRCPLPEMCNFICKASTYQTKAACNLGAASWCPRRLLLLPSSSVLY